MRKKVLKKVKRDIPWLEHIINDEKAAGDFNPGAADVEILFRRGSLCIFCRGGKMLCGKTRCPAIVRLYSLLKVKNLVGSERIFGSSPPGVFVGRIGYPYVYAGPLIPPVLGDTSLLDMPESWVGRSMDEIIGFRTGLIRGKFRVNVKKPFGNEPVLSRTIEIALSREPVDIEALFKRKPSGSIIFDDEVQPMGPSAPLSRIEVENAKLDHRIERAYNDMDLKAEEAVLSLYLNGVPLSRIQRAFSVGAFGVKKQRRMVPTRWSITAVDSTVSRRLIEDKVKSNPEISEYRVYGFEYLGNRFIILLTPSKWRYEWIEAWYPGTLWNPSGEDIAMGSDCEGYSGRTSYASLGGCYYAVRLAAAEFLAREGRQAGVIAMREIHPSFIMPLGVWINRECVREALKRGCERFNTLNEALEYIGLKFSIPIREWVKTSRLIKDDIFQEKITKYLKLGA
ncbi:MAG: Nre family DNA repair protein [Candidatus Bathyarchaeota archaeon]|nr:Nre family DNA repair protein [Candidatus Bathyarchaeota archaeon]